MTKKTVIVKFVYSAAAACLGVVYFVSVQSVRHNVYAVGAEVGQDADDFIQV